MTEATPPTDRDTPDWRTLHLWQIQPLRDALVIAAVVGLVLLGYRLSLVTVPMLLALALAYMCEPLVRLMTRVRWINRPMAATVLLVAGVLVLVVPVVLGVGVAAVQGAAFAQATAHHLALVHDSLNAERAEEREAAYAALPGSWQAVRDWLAEVAEPVSGEATDAEPLQSAMAGWATAVLEWAREHASAMATRALGPGLGAVQAAISTVTGVGRFLFGAFLVAFFFYFFCTGYGRLLAFWQRMIPERRRLRVLELARQMDAVVAGFIRGRLTIALVQSGFFTIGYALIGAPMPLIFGPLVGALAIVPYLSLAGIPLVIIAMWLDEPHAMQFMNSWWWTLAAPSVVYAAGQALDEYVLTPRIQGRATGMDTPSILFASLAGGVLMGFYGLLLAIPVAACIRILLREVVWPRVVDWAEGRKRDMLPVDEQ